MAELKPCPFCGSDFYLHSGYCENVDAYWDGGLRGEEYGYAGCFGCNCIIKADTEQEAIKAWNTRISEGQRWKMPHPIDDEQYRQMVVKNKEMLENLSKEDFLRLFEKVEGVNKEWLNTKSTR